MDLHHREGSIQSNHGQNNLPVGLTLSATVLVPS